MTFSALWSFLAVGLPVLGALIANLSSIDLAYHLRAGALILDGHGIPATDTFTFTAAGQPWLDQQWGGQILLAGAYRAGGWTGLAILRAILVGLTFGLTLLACRNQGLGRRPAAWLTIGAFIVAAPTLALRPQLFGLTLFALAILIVAMRRQRPAVVWFLVPLTTVWANVHGSFFLGPVILGLAWLEDRAAASDRARASFVAAVMCVIAACITPFGPQVWTYALGLSTNASVTSRIVEWQPTSLRTIPGILFFASVLLVVLFLARRGRATPWPALAWFGAFFVIGAYAIRGIAWWPIGAVAGMAGLAGSGGRWANEMADRPRPINRFIPVVLGLAGIALLPMWRPTDQGLQAPAGVVGSAPSAITEQLRAIARPGDRLYNPQPYGSWFEFALPGVLVAIDSRIEVFPETVWDDYDAVSGARGDFEQILDRWGVTLVLATPDRDEALIDRLSVDPGWRRTYQDRDGSLFARAGR
jgi:hypothetical protein